MSFREPLRRAADERGIALIMAIGVLAAITITGGAVVAYSSSSARSAGYSSDNTTAAHLAEAGEAYARSILWNAADPSDPNAVGSGSVTIEGEAVTYSGTYDSATQTWTLTGSASLTNPTGAGEITRTIASQVQVTSSGGGGGQPYAIFIGDTNCGNLGLKVNGNNTNVGGGAHSNSRFEVDGNNETFGYASTKGSPCDVITNGTNHDYDGNDEPEIEPEEQAWPYAFDEDDFTCDFVDDRFEFTSHNKTIPTGTYCASELFSVDANYNNGEITVLAPVITIDGNNPTFTPHENGVLFYATGTEEIVLDGNSYDWEGLIYHPGGKVKIYGNTGSTLAGMILAVEVEVVGNSFTMTGTGGPEGKTVGGNLGLVNVAGSHSTG